MKYRFLSLFATIGVIGVGFVLNSMSSAQQKVQTPPNAPTSPAPPLFPVSGENAVVDAANAFLATLSQQQRATVQVALTPQLAAKWSNFPAAVVPRNGVFFRDLNVEQAAAALKVIQLALSKEGFARFQEVRSADDAYAKVDKGPSRGRGGFGNRDRGGPPPGNFGGTGGFGDGPGRPGGFGGGSLFGQGNYIIAFLGKPSKTAPWLLQVGGHHLGFNIYYKGEVGASTPYFLGVQPNVWKDANGKMHAPLAPMRDAMHDLVNSLTPEQLRRAKLGASFSDVYVGPGRDGQFPTHEGVSVMELSKASKDFVKQAIATWTGDTAQAEQYRKLYYSELKQTKVGYAGTTALSDEGDYVRIDGPHVWIEFACQGSDHYHTIWRDRVTDYGAEFSF